MSGELLDTGLWALLVAPLTEFGFMRRALVGCVALALGCARTPAWPRSTCCRWRWGC